MAGVAGYPEPEFAAANSGDGFLVVAGDYVFREPEFAEANLETLFPRARVCGSELGRASAKRPRDPQGGSGGTQSPPTDHFPAMVMDGIDFLLQLISFLL